MERKAVVCLAGTLDTKGTEYAYVKDCLVAAGVDVLVVDCGVLGDPLFEPDIDARARRREGRHQPRATSSPGSRAPEVASWPSPR